MAENLINGNGINVDQRKNGTYIQFQNLIITYYFINFNCLIKQQQQTKRFRRVC